VHDAQPAVVHEHMPVRRRDVHTPVRQRLAVPRRGDVQRRGALQELRQHRGEGRMPVLHDEQTRGQIAGERAEQPRQGVDPPGGSTNRHDVVEHAARPEG
jgi:hypothetical protein